MPLGVIYYSQPECLATYNAFSFMEASRPIASRIGPPCERAFEQLDAAMSNMIDITGQEVRSPDCYCMRGTNQARQYHLDLSLWTAAMKRSCKHRICVPDRPRP